MNFFTYYSKLINKIRLFGKVTHLYRIKKAKKVLKTIKIIAQTPNSNGKILVYLRKINPFVFEELILTVIENSNIQIKRNLKYSGDGGIDGMFKTRYGKVIIQCKRYKSYINSCDVSELCQLVSKEKHACGIFVHTGRTGEKSKDLIKIQNNIIIISGTLLIDLVLNKINIITLLSKHFNKR